MKNKGFVFMETIVVTVILTVAALGIYASFATILSNERKRMGFEDTGYMYRTYAVIKFLNSLNFKQYVHEYFENQNQSIHVFGCNDLLLYNTSAVNLDSNGNPKQISVCEKILNDKNSFAISKIFITKYDLDTIKKCTTNLKKTSGYTSTCNDNSIKKALENVNINFVYYIRTLSATDAAEFRDSYRVIIEYYETTLDNKNKIAVPDSGCPSDYELSGGKCVRRVNKYYYDSMILTV